MSDLLVHCDVNQLSDPQVYRLYLQTVRDVCSVLLSGGGGVFGGDVGRVGGRVPGLKLPVEIGNAAAVRGVVKDGGNFGRSQARFVRTDDSDGKVGGVRTQTGGADGGSFGSTVEAGVGSSGGRGGSEVRAISGSSGSTDCTPAVGKHHKRNVAKRLRKRAVDTAVDHEGFWNSCSEEIRQQLIESKAKMHIAENERRAQVARDEVVRLQSPEGLIQRAMGMVKMAEECAKKQENSAVAGWAATVASSYAESVAMSAPSSVPSYASVASSKSSVSVDGVKRGKYVPKVKSRVEQIKTEISKLMKLHQAMVYRENFKGDNSIQGNVKFELSEILRERIEFLNRNRMT